MILLMIQKFDFKQLNNGFNTAGNTRGKTIHQVMCICLMVGSSFVWIDGKNDGCYKIISHAIPAVLVQALITSGIIDCNVIVLAIFIRFEIGSL